MTVGQYVVPGVRVPAPVIAVPYELTHADVRWVRRHAELAGTRIIHLDARGLPPGTQLGPSPLNMALDYLTERYGERPSPLIEVIR